MSFFGSAKEFFGLGPIENNEDDAYFEDSRYSETSSTAGAGAYDRAERPSRYERDHREVSSTSARALRNTVSGSEFNGGTTMNPSRRRCSEFSTASMISGTSS